MPYCSEETSILYSRLLDVKIAIFNVEEKNNGETTEQN